MFEPGVIQRRERLLILITQARQKSQVQAERVRADEHRDEQRQER
jgi:hypothetical protein